MKRFRLIFFLLSFFVLFHPVSKVFAQADCKLTTNPAAPIPNDAGKITINMEISGVKEVLKGYPFGALSWQFPDTACARQTQLIKKIESPADIDSLPDSVSKTIIDNPLPWDFCKGLVGEGPHNVELAYEYNTDTTNPLATNVITVCSTQTYRIESNSGSCNVIAQYDSQPGTTNEFGDVNNTTWRITVGDVKLPTNYDNIRIDLDGSWQGNIVVPPMAPQTYSENIPAGLRVAGNHRATIYAGQANVFNSQLITSVKMCDTVFNIAPSGATPDPTPTKIPPLTAPAICSTAACANSCKGDCNICPNCPSFTIPTIAFAPQIQQLCDQFGKGPYREKCRDCQIDGKHIWSAIGCLPTELSVLIKDYILTTGVGIGGVIAFLYFIYGCFLILTSSGNPEVIEEAKQIIISSLSGLLLIIFSIFILKVISVDILKLPGFG